MDFLLKPLVIFLNKLSFSRKFLLIGLVFISVAGEVTFFYAQDSLKSLQEINREQIGALYVRKSIHLLDDTLEIGVATHHEDIESVISQKKSEIENHLTELKEIADKLPEFSDEFNQQLGSMAGSWDEIKESSKTPATHNTDDKVNDLVGKISVWIKLVSSRSGMSFDESLDISHLVNIGVNIYPEIVGNINELNIFHKLRESQADVSETEKLRFYTVFGEVSDKVREANDLTTAFERVSDGVYPDVITGLKKSNSAFTDTIKVYRNDIFYQQGKVDTKPELIYKKSIEMQFSTSTSVLDLIERLMTEKYTTFKNKLILIGSVTIAGLLFMILCFIAFYLSIKQTILLLDGMTQGLVSESSFSPAIIPTKDELSQVGVLFNKIGGKLLRTIHDLKLKENELQKKVAEVEEEKAKSDAILAGIGDAVIAVDGTGTIMLANQAALEITGYTPTDLIGYNYSELVRVYIDETMQTPADYIAMGLQGQKRRLSENAVLKTKAGTPLAVDGTTQGIRDYTGKVIACVLVLRDTTKERSIDKAKTEFVLLASHQLRTPLTAISWSAEILKSGKLGDLSDKQKQYINEMYESGQRLIDLVNALLNVSRIDLGTFAIEPTQVNIREIATEVIGELKPLAESKSQLISSYFDPTTPDITSDPKLLRIVMHNLISNAIKYTRDRGEVSLTVKNLDATIQLSIKDSGIGIPLDAQSKIFTKLYRADNAKSNVTYGNGLGLYIVKSIVDQSGGEIWFESAVDQGTTFYVELPKTLNIKREGLKDLVPA